MKTHVVANPSLEICHCEPVRRLVWQSVLQSLPLGEGGSRVSRKRETDEGLASPYGRGARSGRRGFYFPSQSLRDSSPRVGAKGKRIANQ